MVEVVAQEGVEHGELGCDGVVHIAFALGGLAEELEAGLAHLVVAEAGRVDERLEVGKDAVGHLEGIGRAYAGGIACSEARGVVEGPVVGVDVVDEAVHLLVFHLDVGGDAAAVAHLAACAGVVDGGEAVGDAGHGAVWIAVAVVDGLDEPP